LIEKDDVKKKDEEALEQCTDVMTKLVEQLRRKWAYQEAERLMQDEDMRPVVSPVSCGIEYPVLHRRKSSDGLDVSLPHLKQRVVNRLCQLPARPNALQVLNKVASCDITRASDRFSLKVRAQTFKDGDPTTTLGRVTTPDVREIQKVKNTKLKRVQNVPNSLPCKGVKSFQKKSVTKK
jgi:hypothetical protein